MEDELRDLIIKYRAERALAVRAIHDLEDIWDRGVVRGKIDALDMVIDNLLAVLGNEHRSGV